MTPAERYLDKVAFHYDSVLRGYFASHVGEHIYHKKVQFEEGKKFYRCYLKLFAYLGKYCEVIVYHEKSLTKNHNYVNAITTVGYDEDQHIFWDHFTQLYDKIEAYLSRQRGQHRLQTVHARRSKVHKARLLGGKGKRPSTLHFGAIASSYREEIVSKSITLIIGLLEDKQGLPRMQDIKTKTSALMEYVKFALPGKLTKKRLYARRSTK